MILRKLEGLLAQNTSNQGILSVLLLVAISCFLSFRLFFTPEVFAKLLHNDVHGRVSTMAIFNYVMRKVWLQQTRIGLSLYDATGQGFLTGMVIESDTI